MTKQEFKELSQSKIILLDGATGSNLQKRGMTAGVCPEKWILENPEIFIQLQKEYIEAGTDILYAPTFSANRLKLSEYGLESQVYEINTSLIALSKKAIKASVNQTTKKKVFLAGDVTMTGEQLEPIGNLQLEELITIYKEQINAMLQAGIDLFIVETMMSLQECRAAVLAIKETCDLPIMVTLSFQEDNRTLYGTDPLTAAIVLEKLGVDAVGVNCSTGPEKMCEIIAGMKEYTSIPLIAKPNAGLPKLINGITEYDMQPKEFAEGIEKLLEQGASIVGGCCGTTKEHISFIAEKLLQYNSIQKRKENSKKSLSYRFLTTETKTVKIPLDGRFLIVGERINPTGKKALQAELKEGKLSIVRKMAEEQKEYGADILDINMGMNGIDEKEMMLKVIKEVTRIVNLPLCIDSSHIDIMEAALRIYPGRALINSISLEKEKLEKLLPIAKKYGAMFILLPLSDEGLPKNLKEKKEIIHKIVDRAISLGMEKEDIIVDGLVTTVGANKNAALETLETIHYCKEELGLATICGLSNISFGLPERTYVNATFLALAIQAGLTLAIANPSQDLLMNAAFAADLLMAKQDSDKQYIERVVNYPITIVKGKNVQAITKEPQQALYKKNEKEAETCAIFTEVV